MNETILDMQHVTVDRGIRKKVLNIEGFTLHRGELAAVVGPNGSGKSTFLQLVNLLHRYQGRMELFGQDASRSDATMLRRRSAMVFQEALLLNDTVYNNVAMALRFRGIAAGEIKGRVFKALADFHCDHLADRQARALSGGEGQRVSIARALVTNPDLLLLDEPFASLDAGARGELIEEIRQMAEARGISVLLVSHNFTDVLYFAERAVALFGGCIVQDANPEIIMRRPVNEKVARLAGMENIIPCRIERYGKEPFISLDNGVEFKYPGEVSRPVSACCIPGDALHLYDDCLLGLQGSWVIIEGEVERITPGAGAYHILVKLGEHRLRARVPRYLIPANIQNQAKVKLIFNPAEVHMV
jgi:tungstate transport system ATP-binding protein